jgi:hypothetical protein
VEERRSWGSSAGEVGGDRRVNYGNDNIQYGCGFTKANVNEKSKVVIDREGELINAGGKARKARVWVGI